MWINATWWRIRADGRRLHCLRYAEIRERPSAAAIRSVGSAPGGRTADSETGVDTAETSTAEAGTNTAEAGTDTAEAGAGTAEAGTDTVEAGVGADWAGAEGEAGGLRNVATLRAECSNAASWNVSKTIAL